MHPTISLHRIRARCVCHIPVTSTLYSGRYAAGTYLSTARADNGYLPQHSTRRQRVPTPAQHARTAGTYPSTARTAGTYPSTARADSGYLHQHSAYRQRVPTPAQRVQTAGTYTSTARADGGYLPQHSTCRQRVPTPAQRVQTAGTYPSTARADGEQRLSGELLGHRAEPGRRQPPRVAVVHPQHGVVGRRRLLTTGTTFVST